MSDELLELASECEAASGPVLKLDERILKAIGGKKRSDDWWLGYAYIGRVIPAYTKSLDSAGSLVPDGRDYSVSREGTCGVAYTFSGFDGVYDPDCSAATPALALCAAALRARASRLRMEVE